MILSPVAQRESYTQQVSLKIGISLEQKFIDIARQRNTHINNIFRDAFVQYVAPPDTATYDVSQLTVLTQRILQLEAENKVLRENVAPTLTPDQIAYEAFANERIIAAIRDISERVENADIEYRADAIIQQFVSFIPSLA